MVLERLRGWLSRRGRREDRGSSSDGTDVFRARYHSLCLLLAANNKALDTMAEMEEAALGDRVFGMAFIRSRCTAAGVSVFSMVRNLDALAPETYSELFSVLGEIQGKIQRLLEAPGPVGTAPLVLRMSEISRHSAGTVGSKMANLGEVGNTIGLRVPPGFAITDAAFDLLLSQNDLKPEIDSLIQTADHERPGEIFALSSRLQQLVINAEIPSTLAESVAAAYEELAADVGGRPSVALRSSAIGEDAAETSFAGQYRTELNVRPQNILEAYRQVAASKYTPQAMQYLLQRGLRDDQLAMCVGCIAMIDARCGGVTYTGNPRNAADRRIIINAAPGLPKAVVDGQFAADEFVLAREEALTIVERRIVSKTARIVLDPAEGLTREALPEAERQRPTLDDDEVLQVAEAALRIERHYGLAQDVEWAIDRSGEITVLQSRPLQQVVSSRRDLKRADGRAPLVAGGTCVSPGAAAGPVFRVERDGDALRFPEGAVLVVSHPLPKWAALLPRAAAVVASEGGIAGHLATVARESGVPGVFGVADLSPLTEGVEVTVDADRSAVYAGVDQSLLDEAVKRRPMMIGSPVHETLIAVLQHVAPLHLLDPDDLRFRPSSCRTMHDITRFCHEKAVREMFDFGKNNRFPKHASKQLHHNVPMQWWVLDLEDGFTHEIPGKYVRLEEITCRPMLSLWEGMVAVPWEGPPAMSGRGFASVLFEATANPALSTPFRKPYAQQNYFMISRRFMNLQSRFGFHFAAVESVIGDREHENYLSFSFKGGAADLDRRSGRVRFICEILAERGFSVAAREDHATARLAGLPSDAMDLKLEIVGYLIMHTRQLDMIMGSPVAVAHYGAKIRADLDRIEGRTENGPD